MQIPVLNQTLISPAKWVMWALLMILAVDAQSRDTFTIEQLGSHNLSHGAYFIEDPSAELSIEDVMASDQWTRNYKNSFVFGYSASAYWVTVTLKVEHADRWYAVVTYPVLDYLDFYWVKDNKVVEHHQAGDRILFSERPIHTREFVFLRDLDAGEEITFYLRVKTEGSYQIPIKLKSSEAFQESLSKFEFMLGMFYGVLFIMTIYNLVLYLITNVTSYLYYVIYVVTTLFSRMAFDGSGFELLWPNSPETNEWILPVGFQVSTLAFWLFSYQFLNVKNAQATIKVLFGVVFMVMALNLILMPFIDYTLNVQIQSLLAAVALIVALILSMFMTVTGSWYAAVFCIATMLSSLAFVIAVFGALGKFDNPEFSIFGYAYARVFEIILFAIALGVRIRHVNNLRIQAEAEAKESREISIKNLEQYRRLYESALTGNAVLAKDGRITSVNQAFVGIFDIHGDTEDLGNIRNYFVEDQLDKVFIEISPYRSVAEAELQLKNGRWVSLLLNHVDMDDEHVYECTFLDVTDRIESDRIKEQAQKDKMASLQQLVIGISNELNHPLGIVRESANNTKQTLENLHRASSKGELTKDAFKTTMLEGETALTLADSNVIRLGDMIASFKKVSVQQMSYKSEELNVDTLVDLLETAADEVEAILTKTISNQCKGSFVTFPMAIYWILTELVNNANDNLDSDQRLRVQCQVYINELEMVIEFLDNGRGLPEESIDKIFDPFFSHKQNKENKLGLGLYQVYNLVSQLLKGEIEAKNQNGLLVRLSIPNLRVEHHQTHIVTEPSHG